MMAMVAGYDARKVDGWQQTRLIIHTIACTVTEQEKRRSIYEILPLPGDPSREELEKRDMESYEELLNKQRDFTNMVREELRNANQNKK